MTVLYCLASFMAGIAGGWILFKPKSPAEYEDDNEDEDEECSSRYVHSMDEVLEDDVDDDEPFQKDCWPDDELCDECDSLACDLSQSKTESCKWKCLRNGRDICFTISHSDSILRPDWCIKRRI